MYWVPEKKYYNGTLIMSFYNCFVLNFGITKLIKIETFYEYLPQNGSSSLVKRNKLPLPFDWFE